MATAVHQSRSAQIHQHLAHPVVDADAHWLESVPVFYDYVKSVGGQRMLDELEARAHAGDRWFLASPEQRVSQRITRPNYWFGPGPTIDRATSMIPKLLNERLPDFGIDFAIVYPTIGLGGFQGYPDDLRRCCIRAYNIMAADMFKTYAQRLTPAGIIPTLTPQEGIEEAEFIVNQLGLKVGMLHGVIQRPLPADAAWQPEPSRRRHYYDPLGLDSPYDYDPLWAKLVELKLAYTSHSGTMGDTTTRSSPSSVIYSRVGHFAQAHHMAAKGLLLGGVLYRFPELSFAFLEAGVAWAVNLCLDLVSIFDKFGRAGLERDLKPTNVDADYLRRLFDEYATDPQFQGHVERIFAEHHLFPNAPYHTPEQLVERGNDWDEFAAAHAKTAEEVRRQFTDNLYFGCESDDPTLAWAFDNRMAGARLKTLFSSDISHFDVRDMTEVLEEAWESVEHGLITESDFRELTFSNVVRMHGRMNPEFFKGTVVEEATSRELAAQA